MSFLQTGRDLLNPEPGSVERVDKNGIKYNGIRKHGRIYPAAFAGKYPFPCDEHARRGEDHLHAIVYGLCHGQRGLHGEEDFPAMVAAPLVDVKPQRVLDVGCGSGVWCADVARRYPNAQIVGLDLVEGNGNYRNTSWRVPGSPDGGAIDFNDENWNLDDRFDYVRLAHLNGAVTNEEALMRNCFQRTTLGTGYIEVTFIDWHFRLEEGTLRSSSPLAKLSDLLSKASRVRKVPLAPNLKTGALLESTGYIDVVYRKHRLPLSGSSWDRRQHLIGRQMMSLLYNCKILESMSLVLLTEYLGTSVEDVRKRVDDCVKQAYESEGKPYVELHTWTARRPGEEHRPLPVDQRRVPIQRL